MASNLKDLQALILWARKNQIGWSSLTCGTLHIEGADMKPDPTAPKRSQEAAAAPQSMYAKYGGALLEQNAGDKAGDVQTSVVVEEDYE